ncbi:MAG: diguanylate cyclase [Spirochaetales bacterium]|nr:diguanylate cyclase [Spirochaetales bacterium]MCF7939541.1 diguanylate cyclase [Spirochaetales bacterium]
MRETEDAHILIVDDILDNLQLLGTIVRDAGYQVAAASSGKEAIDYAVKTQPDLVLLDIMMPDMDGIETCRRLKADTRTDDIPVIFITALDRIEDKVKAFEAGGVDFITKPYIREEVRMRVQVHLRLRFAIQQVKKQARTDDLTGVFNRRAAYELLKKHINLSRRENYSLVICYIDIDNLKEMNDRYGHEAGDRLIVTTADAILDRIRKSDYVFRMGGDEFMLLFPKAEVEEARSLIERIQAALGREEINRLPVEFSYGFSTFRPESKETLEELIGRADQSMYRLKQQKKVSEKSDHSS